MLDANAKVKYLYVGLTIFSEQDVKSICYSQDAIEVKCKIEDEHERKDLETYGWEYYEPHWRFKL
jgi:hypothetical protein